MGKWTQFLTQIVDETDMIALKHYHSVSLEVNEKPDFSPVSAGDLEIETVIRKRVAECYPDMSIVGEEYGETVGGSTLKLIIDPIDGTKNFIRKLPFFATLLAIEEEEQVIAGMVSAPAQSERWWAERGEGSFYNGEGIRVSTINQLKQSLACHGSLFGSEAADEAAPVLDLLSETDRQRGFGDYYPHMLVAMGRAEFAIDFKLKCWDVAPLKIIVEEAGGRYSDTGGTASIYSGNIISSNGHLHTEVQSRIFDLQ